MWGLEARGRFSKLSRYGLKSGSPQLGGIPRDPLSARVSRLDKSLSNSNGEAVKDFVYRIPVG